jgi:hypothetical protein
MHYAELVKAALNARPGWVPLGPLDAARRGWKQFTYPRANYLADLERVGLIICAPSRSGKTAAIRLTLACRQTITDMPDNLQRASVAGILQTGQLDSSKRSCRGKTTPPG